MACQSLVICSQNIRNVSSMGGQVETGVVTNRVFKSAILSVLSHHNFLKEWVFDWYSKAEYSKSCPQSFSSLFFQDVRTGLGNTRRLDEMSLKNTSLSGFPEQNPFLNHQFPCSSSEKLLSSPEVPPLGILFHTLLSKRLLYRVRLCFHDSFSQLSSSSFTSSGFATDSKVPLHAPQTSFSSPDPVSFFPSVTQNKKLTPSEMFSASSAQLAKSFELYELTQRKEAMEIGKQKPLYNQEQNCFSPSIQPFQLSASLPIPRRIKEMMKVNDSPVVGGGAGGGGGSKTGIFLHDHASPTPLRPSNRTPSPFSSEISSERSSFNALNVTNPGLEVNTISNAPGILFGANPYLINHLKLAEHRLSQQPLSSVLPEEPRRLDLGEKSSSDEEAALHWNEKPRYLDNLVFAGLFRVFDGEYSRPVNQLNGSLTLTEENTISNEISVIYCESSNARQLDKEVVSPALCRIAQLCRMHFLFDAQNASTLANALAEDREVQVNTKIYLQDIVGKQSFTTTSPSIIVASMPIPTSPDILALNSLHKLYPSNIAAGNNPNVMEIVQEKQKLLLKTVFDAKENTTFFVESPELSTNLNSSNPNEKRKAPATLESRPSRTSPSPLKLLSNIKSIWSRSHPRQIQLDTDLELFFHRLSGEGKKMDKPSAPAPVIILQQEIGLWVIEKIHDLYLVFAFDSYIKPKDVPISDLKTISSSLSFVSLFDGFKIQRKRWTL